MDFLHYSPTRILLFLSVFYLCGKIFSQNPGENESAGCVCNPEDADTGRVCANNGQTYESACDFRLKQGLKADIGIRCVGSCPCDDTQLALGIDCGAAAAATATPVASGLEFCGTNAVTYANENMFMCDQVQDQTLAISCPGPCPCQLSDCPAILRRTANASLPLIQPTSFIIPPNNTSPYAPPLQGYGVLSPALPQPNPIQPYIPQPAPLQPPAPQQGYGQGQDAPIPVNNAPLVVPVPVPGPYPAELTMQPRPSYQAPLLPAQQGYTRLPEAQSVPVNMQPAQNFPVRQLQRDSSSSPSRGSGSIISSPYNPLVEALRSVPFRLFRHLYILITVAAEGMKQIPMQIGKNMQARLPPYVREIPIELAKSIQEALSIHLNSLAQQVKDTVEQVRLLIDENNSNSNA